jgi:hypothetical protein
VVLLRQQGLACSTSIIGGIRSDRPDPGVLKEPLLMRVSAGKWLQRWPRATPKPMEYFASQPGEIVEVETLDIRTAFRKPLKQFTAPDVVAR